MNGWCAFHQLEYKLVEPDDVCPRCLAAKAQDLAERDTEQDKELDENHRLEYGDLD